MAEKYLPLEMIKLARAQKDDEWLMDYVKEQYCKSDTTTEDIVNWVLDPLFLDDRYKGPLQRANTMLRQDPNVIRMLAHYIPIERANKRSLVVELRDLFLYSELLIKWGTHKRVYKVDPVFFTYLESSTSLVVPETFGQYLPFLDYYVDLSEIANLQPIVGAFVHIHGNQMVAYMVTKDQCYFSYYTTFNYEHGVYEIPESAKPSTPFVAPYCENEKSATMQQKLLDNDQRGTIAKNLIRLTMFLASKKPDVQPSPITQKTYRKPTMIRDKFSEVRIDDVGVRYGKAIRLAEQQAKRIKENADKDEQQEVKAQPAHVRKPMRMHVRAAHWQRYHVGEGRKEIRLNWIAPIFVCGNAEIPVTIQEIKM